MRGLCAGSEARPFLLESILTGGTGAGEGLPMAGLSSQRWDASTVTDCPAMQCALTHIGTGP